MWKINNELHQDARNAFSLVHTTKPNLWIEYVRPIDRSTEPYMCGWMQPAHVRYSEYFLKRKNKNSNTQPLDIFACIAILIVHFRSIERSTEAIYNELFSVRSFACLLEAIFFFFKLNMYMYLITLRVALLSIGTDGQSHGVTREEQLTATIVSFKKWFNASVKKNMVSLLNKLYL